MGSPTEGDALTLEQIQADPRWRSRDDSGIAALAIGTLLWIVALVVVLALGYQGKVVMVCALGAALGVPGMVLAAARRARLRRSRAVATNAQPQE